MRMKQIKAMAAAGVMAAVLCAGTGLNVKADVPQAGTQDASIEKNLHIADGITVPTTTFTFRFAKVTPDAPEIPDKAVDYSNKDTVSEHKVTKTAESILSGVTFPHAGEFVYMLTEEIPKDNTLEGGKMTYDTSEWTLRIYVKNTASGDLEVSNITASKEGNEKKQEKIFFDNKFEKTTTLEVEKQTEGELADRTKKFDFVIRFAKAPTLDEGITSFTTSDGRTYEYGKDHEFKLSDDEKIVFDNLPAGTTYEVVENGAKDNYVPSVKVTENGAMKEIKLDKAHEAEALSSTQVHEEGKLNLAGEGKNHVTFTNTIDNADVPVTGVMMNSMPYIILMLAAGAGFIGYIIVKRHHTTL